MKFVSPIRTTEYAARSVWAATMARQIWYSSLAEVDLSVLVPIPNIERLLDDLFKLHALDG